MVVILTTNDAVVRIVVEISFKYIFSNRVP